MRFLCPKCKAKYQIADEKLEGRAVRMKCRKCGHILELPCPANKGIPPKRSQAKAAAPRLTSSKTPSLHPKKVDPDGQGRGAQSRSVRVPSQFALDKAGASSVPPPSGGALANAFTQSIREPLRSDVSAAIEALSSGSNEEWYVGINGVPLGPVRLSTLRQKAAQGVVAEDSLVWREGFREWLPLRTFPELVALVREAPEQSSRPLFSLPPPPPQGFAGQAPSSQSPLPTVPVAAELRPGAAAEIEREPPSRAATSGQAHLTTGHVLSDPFAVGATATSEAENVSAQPILAPAQLPAAAAGMDDDERASLVDDLEFGVKRPPRMHPAAYVLIAIGFGFGATGAVVFFTADKAPAPPPTIQVVTVAAPNSVAFGAAAPADSLAINTQSPEASSHARGSKRSVSSATKSNGTKVGNGNEGDNSPPRRVGLGGGPDIDGPSVDGPGSNKNIPQQLSQSDIERVVIAHRGTVKRRCWEAALRTRDPSAPKSAKVTVSITVAPSGNVSSASASGGAGYPGLASCVAGKVRGWKFPPSGGSSRANIPFAFFSQ